MLRPYPDKYYGVSVHFHLVDAYQDSDSLLHRADPRVKLVLTLLLILFISLTPVGAFAVYVGYFALMMAGALAGRLDPWAVLKRAAVAIPFAGAAITLLFTVPGRSLGVVPWLGWSISEAGLIRFASIMFKSVVSVQAGVILIFTTHFTDVVWALGALRVPPTLVAILSFMYRYSFLLVEEALRLTRARESRSALPAGQRGRSRDILFQARSTGRMIGALLVRSFERSERVYLAMAARGYRGEMKRLNPPPLRAADFWLASVALSIGAALLALSIV